MIVGINEVLGLEEILTKQDKWMSSVTCYSTTARAYFFKKEDFLRLLKQRVLDSEVVMELSLKRKISMQRLSQMKKGYKQMNEEMEREFGKRPETPKRPLALDTQSLGSNNSEKVKAEKFRSGSVSSRKKK